MSQPEPNHRFAYSDMTDDDARRYLREEFGEAAIDRWRSEIISAVDVLYYADAYGDLDDAILLQGWDKSLPARVHKGLLNAGLDLYEGRNTHELTTERCPACGSEMWRFEIDSGAGHTQTEWVDEWGNVTSDVIEYVENKDGYLWNAAPEDDHAPVLCPVCSIDVFRDFPRRPDESGTVRVHYGETGEISGFSKRGNLIRWDFEIEFGRGTMTDLWGLPGGEDGLPKAFATGSVTDWLAEYDWTEIAQQAVTTVSGPFASNTAVGREYRKLATEWAVSDTPHPDLDFTYVIDLASFGYPSFLVAEEHHDELLTEIVDLIERRL